MKLYKTFHLVTDSRSNDNLEDLIQKALNEGSAEGYTLSSVNYSTCAFVNYDETVVFSAVVVMEK